MDVSQFKNLVSDCKNCGQCNLCPTHVAGVFNPLGVLREMQMGTPESVVKTESIFNCLTCNQCMTNCPAHTEEDGINFANLIQSLRVYANENNLVPQNKPESSGHCALLQSENFNLVDVKQYFPERTSLKISDQGEIAYFVGCLPVLNEKYSKFGFDYSQIPVAVVRILNRLKISPVVLNMNCCGHDDLWAGNQNIFRKLAEANVKRYRDVGVKIIITTCAEGYRTWKYDYPKIIPDFEFKVYHISEFLQKDGLYKKLRLDSSMQIKVTYQDPCRLGRLGGGKYEPAREILKFISGVDLIEMESNKENAQCCGCGIFLQETEGIQEMWLNRLKEAQFTGADYLITACPKCATHFQYVLQNLPAIKDLGPIPTIKDWTVFLSRFLQ